MPKVQQKKHCGELKATAADAAPVKADCDRCEHCGEVLFVKSKWTFHGDEYDVCEECEEPAPA